MPAEKNDNTNELVRSMYGILLSPSDFSIKFLSRLIMFLKIFLSMQRDLGVNNLYNSSITFSLKDLEKALMKIINSDKYYSNAAKLAEIIRKKYTWETIYMLELKKILKCLID